MKFGNLRARTSQRKRTPTSIYTNKEETRKKGSRKKKKQEKTASSYINAAGTVIMVSQFILLLDKSLDLMNKIKGYWEDTDNEFDGYVQEVKMNF